MKVESLHNPHGKPRQEIDRIKKLWEHTVSKYFECADPSTPPCQMFLESILNCILILLRLPGYVWVCADKQTYTWRVETQTNWRE